MRLLMVPNVSSGPRSAKPIGESVNRDVTASGSSAWSIRGGGIDVSALTCWTPPEPFDSPSVFRGGFCLDRVTPVGPWAPTGRCRGRRGTGCGRGLRDLRESLSTTPLGRCHRPSIRHTDAHATPVAGGAGPRTRNVNGKPPNGPTVVAGPFLQRRAFLCFPVRRVLRWFAEYTPKQFRYMPGLSIFRL